jgi:gas vesicle structural protein
MAVAHAAPSGYIERPRPSGLADVIDIILDKGLVIDAYIRVSLIGIELIVIDARIVIASVDTYLRFAEAVNRLDLSQTPESQTLPELLDELREGGASSKTKGALEGVKEKLGIGDGDDDDDDGKKSSSRSRSTSRSSSSRSSGSGSKSSSGSGSKSSGGSSGSRSRSRKSSSSSNG